MSLNFVKSLSQDSKKFELIEDIVNFTSKNN